MDAFHYIVILAAIQTNYFTNNITTRLSKQYQFSIRCIFCKFSLRTTSFIFCKFWKLTFLTSITTEGALRLLTTYDNPSSNPIPFHPSDFIRLNSVRRKTNSRKPIFWKGCWNLSIKPGDLVGRCIVAAHFRGRIRNKNQAWWHLSLQIRGIQGSTSLKVTFQLL